MKVLFFSHYFPPEVNAPATRTFEHCRRWADRGADVTVVTCVPNCPSGVVFDGFQNRLRTQTETKAGIRVHRVWTHLAPNAGTVRRTINYLTYLWSAVWCGVRLPRPDVVIATSPQFFCGWAGAIVAKLLRVPFVLEVRDIWPESIETVGAIRFRPLLHFLELLERLLYRSADHIVTVGPGYRERIVARVDVADRCSVIPNGVDLDEFEPRARDQQLGAQWNSAGKFVCSYAGTIGMAHGLEVVVEAACILRDWGRRDIVFWLVGDGAERARVEQLAGARGVIDAIVFAGLRGKEEVKRIIASSDVCLVSLRRSKLFETVIPSKIFESLAMQKPVLLAGKGAAADIVRSARAGFVIEPGDPQSLATALASLADHPQKLRQMTDSARAFVANRFDRERLAQAYRDLLEAIVTRRTVVPIDAMEVSPSARAA